MTAKYSFTNVGEIVESISLLLKNEQDADAFLEQYLDYMVENNTEGWDRAKCREVCLQNVGYCAGYINVEAIGTVNRLLGATHIAYGAGIENGA